ncbi:ABC transporter permease [Roseivirga misakiensis]|uniref:Uncharacterized protein n=1 Tax=Roseivirga misakiensis TaxID=1563681 RepID=A0A1E5T0M8_9BACT|nr:ABC transporter permease [Roseivirga misakiensis]OEK04938.1 hypothetical protein BFP71_16005 [Roseivirga misakiensis]
MIWSKLKFAIRAISRYNFFTHIQILGLAVALSATCLIYFFVNTELNVDSHISEKETIYRVIRKVEEANSSYKSPTLPGPFNDLISLRAELPKENILRVYQDDELITYDNQSFFEPNVLYVDNNFLDVLDYKLQIGNPATILKNVNSAVISSRIAKKYFDKTNPIGETLEVEGKGTIEIAGVLAEETTKSHLQVDFLVNNSAMGYSSRFLTDKETHVFSYYLKIPSQALEVIEYALKDLSDEHLNLNTSKSVSLELQPLTDIYLDEPMKYDIAQHNNWVLIQTLVVIGIILLTVVAANFVNLNIAKLFKGVKKVGIKKVLGSTTRTLIFDWALEVYLVILFATLVAYGGCYFILPYLSQPFGINVSLPQTNTLILIIFLIPTLLTSIITAVPAFILLSIKPSETLKGKVTGVKTNVVQQGLLSMQFATAFVMIVLTVVIVKQFQFMQSKEIGLNGEQVLIFDSNNKHSWQNRNHITDEIKKISGVKDIAMAYGGLPKSPSEISAYEIDGLQFQWNTAIVQPNLIDLLDIKIVAGRTFDEQIVSEMESSVLLNESAAKMLGWPQKNLVGQNLSLTENSETKKVIGIVKDYHYQSLKSEIEPLVLQSSNWGETFIVKIASQNYAGILSEVEEVWKQYVPRYPFYYRFLDDSFQQMHLEDTKNRQIIFLFTILTILITSMGTLSMVALIQESKVKEVTIRKVLGAPLSGIFYLLSFNFVKVLTFSSLIAVPLAWLMAKRWLDEFSYRIDISPSLFLIGFSLLSVIIITLIISQSWKTATLNPVKRLRAE